MFQIALNASDFSVAQSIKLRCSNLGRVMSVKVYRSPLPFALIEMATHEDASQCVLNFNGSIFGSCVLVRLLPTPTEQSSLAA